MQIAILGATSMLAADYVAASLSSGETPHFTLFARDPARAHAAQANRGIGSPPECRPLERFEEGAWDAIINFIGVGDPGRAVAMGADILTITRHWDDRILAYLDRTPDCRYLFLSSGAIFAEGLAQPVDPATRSIFHLNDLPPSSFYGVAKFYAEAVHRAHTGKSIIDVRIFNYLSEQADLSHRFLITEAIAAIRDKQVLNVDAREMWRDYLGQEDLVALIQACLAAPVGYNGAIDAYSKAPISKTQLLTLLGDRFGLRVAVAGGGINATGTKSSYYSTDHRAAALGYRPRYGSDETLERVTHRILARP